MSVDEDSRQIRKLTTDLHKFLDELRSVTGSKKENSLDVSQFTVQYSKNAPGLLTAAGPKSSPAIEQTDPLSKKGK